MWERVQDKAEEPAVLSASLAPANVTGLRGGAGYINTNAAWNDGRSRSQWFDLFTTNSFSLTLQSSCRHGRGLLLNGIQALCRRLIHFMCGRYLVASLRSATISESPSFSAWSNVELPCRSTAFGLAPDPRRMFTISVLRLLMP